MKKLLSLLMTFIIALASLAPMTAFAQSYEDSLRAKGFPEQYISKLTKLHKEHPKWIFEPMDTKLKWSDAVAKERTPHSDQLIEKCSLYSSDMYCSCSSCYSNGNYKIQEAGGWVSASQKAVEYYMNPLNFLDEKYIFQFESTSYDGTQTKEGVEAILKGTWMYDSLITYRTTSGSTKLYDDKTKYSDVIMEAANYAGISAYYLAAKIKQENGGSTASATAVNGGTSPFQGIYNYYNIGAYTGAMDGLAWAAGFLKLNSSSTLYSKYDSSTKKVSGTKTKLSAGQYMTWRANAGNYYKVRLYDEVGGSYKEGATGYVAISDCRTTYLGDTSTGYGRPWSNPVKAIKYGAKYIAKSFGTQHTGYLQKFNVNPASSYRFDNEYMKNVAGASSEALSTYDGYKSAGILDITKKFSIPIYSNMPDSVGVTGLKVDSFTTSSVTLSWKEVKKADGYEVQYSANGKWTTYVETKDTSIAVENLSCSSDYAFRVRSFVKSGSAKAYSDYSDIVNGATKSKKMSKPFSVSSTSTSVTVGWKKQNSASGYAIYVYSGSEKKYKHYKSVSGDTTTLEITNRNPNTKYKIEVCAFKTINGVNYKGAMSKPVSIRTKKNTTPTLASVTSPSTRKIDVKWSKISGVTGYEVMWSTSSDFSSNFLSVKVKGASKLSTTLTTAQSNKKYYVRVRAYKTSDGSTTSYPWSAKKSLTVK